MTYDEKKFEALNALLKDMRPGGFINLHHLPTLGDTYEELIENLNRIADAGVILKITPRAGRAKYEPYTTGPARLINYGSRVQFRADQDDEFVGDTGRVISMRDTGSDIIATVHWKEANKSSQVFISRLELVRE